MDKCWSTVCTLILIFSMVRAICRTVDPSRVRCPRHLPLPLWHKGCEDCPDDQICCVYGGEDICIAPASKKPGMCPSGPSGSGRCLISCFSDADCLDNKKCCFNGCGHECMAAVTEYCPWHLDTSLSHKGCKDCPKDHKCCVYDGEDFCVPPVSTKPGFCPFRHIDVGLCVESCLLDSECPDDEKCCFNGCGHQCKAPAID